MKRFFTLTLFVVAVFCFSAPIVAQTQALRGTEWEIHLQKGYNSREFEIGDFIFKEVKGSKVECIIKLPGQKDQIRKESLKGGVLSVKFKFGTKNVESKIFITKSFKGSYFSPALGKWREVGKKDWAQANLIHFSRQLKDTKPIRDLVKWIIGKKLALSSGAKDKAPTLGILKVTKVTGNSVEAEFTSRRKGAVTKKLKNCKIHGSILVLSLLGKQDCHCIFYQEGKTWRAQGLFGPANVQVKAMVKLEEQKP